MASERLGKILIYTTIQKNIHEIDFTIFFYEGLRSNPDEDRMNIKCKLHKRCTMVDVNMICLKEGVPPGKYLQFALGNFNYQ